MYKVKRTIYVDNQSIDVWFGLVSKTKNGKNGKYTVYLLTDDPNNPYNHVWGDLICGIQQSKLCCQLSKIVYWLARSDFIRPFAGLCSECTRARTGKEASTKAD